MTSAEAQQILYLAAGARIGLVIWSSDPVKCIARMYSERSKLRDPGLGELQFRRTEQFEGGNLVITKAKVEVKGELGL